MALEAVGNGVECSTDLLPNVSAMLQLACTKDTANSSSCESNKGGRCRDIDVEAEMRGTMSLGNPLRWKTHLDITCLSCGRKLW